MADAVEEKDDEDDWSEAMTDERGTSKNASAHEKMSSENLPVESKSALESIRKVASAKDAVSFQTPKSQKTPAEDDEANPGNPRNPRSECRARSRDTRKCAKHFQEMLGKHETRNVELEQQEGDLRRRLQTLECSMPAVMVWNIWRMARGAPNAAVRRMVEKQFEGYGADETTVPTTPSRHWDDRVRRIEAQRKEAQRRAEEARSLLAEKEAAVLERRKRLDEARKCNRERKEKMEKLTSEAAVLRNARGDDTSQAEDARRGKENSLVGGVGARSSVSSIASTDLECFARLQELAEAEVCMKRQISELERREEAYMRTLQQADEMCARMEGDTADTVSGLHDQLRLKTAANQQLADRICQLEDELEGLKKRLIGTKDELSKFTDREHDEAAVGLDDGEAGVKSRGVVAAVKTATTASAAAPKTTDQESTAQPETSDAGSNVVAAGQSDAGVHAAARQFDKGVEPIPVPIQVHRGVDPVTGLVVSVRVGDEEGIPDQWKDWNWDEGCPPGAVCDDMVESSTGTDDVTKVVTTSESKVQAAPVMVERTAGGQDEAEMTVSDSDRISLSREELRNWYNIVDSVQHMIAKCDNCSSKTDDIAQLAEQMKLHLRIKGLAGVKTPTIVKKIASGPVIAPEEQSGLPASSTDVKPEGISDETMPHISQDVAGIDDKINLRSTEIEQVESDLPVLLASSEEGVTEVMSAVEFPIEVAEDVNLPSAEYDAADAEMKPSETYDKTANAPKSQIDLTEEEAATVDEDVSVSVDDTPRIEEKSMEETSDSAPMQVEAESVEPLENRSLVESQFAPAEDLTDSGLAASVLADEAAAEMDVEVKSDHITEEYAEAKEMVSGSEGDDLKFEDAVDTLEQMQELLPSRDDVEPHSDSNVAADENTTIEETSPSVLAPTSPSSKIDLQPENREDPPTIENADGDSQPETAILEVENEIPTTMEIEDEIPTTVEIEDEIPTTLEIEDEIPTTVEIEDEIPTTVEIEDEIPPVLKVEDEVPSAVEVENEIPSVSEVQDEIASALEVDDEIPSAVVIEDEMPSALEIDDETPPVLEVEDEVPSAVEIKDEIPSASEVQDETPSALEVDDEIPSALVIEDEMPSALEIDDEIPSDLEIKDEIPSVTDFKDDQSVLDISETERSTELIAEKNVEALLSAAENVPDDTEQVPEVPDADQLEKVESDKVFITKTLEGEEQPTIIDADETPQLETAVLEVNDEIPVTADLEDDQSLLDTTKAKRSSEMIVEKEVETPLRTPESVLDDTEQVTELSAEVPEAEKLKDLESGEVSTTKSTEAEEQPAITADKSPPPETAVSEAPIIGVKEDSATEPKIPEARSHPDAEEIELAADKLEEDVSWEGKIIDRPRVAKPYLSIVRVESSEKLALLKPVARCICKPPTCPLLGRAAGRQAQSNVPRLGTDGAQTSLPDSKTSLRLPDKQRLKTISEGARESLEEATWRRPRVRTRRPRDKSAVTTVCVDTQTHRALVRGKIALEGIARKDDSTCSGGSSRDTEHGGCAQRLPRRTPDERHPAPVGLVELLGCAKPPTSMTSTLEKEIAVVRYTGRSLAPEDSLDRCVECRRPMTPAGTAVSTRSALATGSQKSLIASLKKATSSVSQVTCKEDSDTCRECKKSSKVKSVSRTRSKRGTDKDSDAISRGEDTCCSCPTEVSKKASSRSSRKKRKPEMRDQAVMVNIPRSVIKVTSAESRVTDENKNKSPSATASKTKSDDKRINVASKASTLSKESYCNCEELSNDPSIAGDEAVRCDCLSNDSVSKGSSCNCTEDVN